MSSTKQVAEKFTAADIEKVLTVLDSEERLRKEPTVIVGPAESVHEATEKDVADGGASWQSRVCMSISEDGLKLYMEERCTYGGMDRGAPKQWTNWRKSELEDTADTVPMSWHTLKCLVTGVLLLVEELDGP